MAPNDLKWAKNDPKWPPKKRLRISAKFCHWNPKNSEIRRFCRNSAAPGGSGIVSCNTTEHVSQYQIAATGQCPPFQNTLFSPHLAQSLVGEAWELEKLCSNHGSHLETYLYLSTSLLLNKGVLTTSLRLSSNAQTLPSQCSLGQASSNISQTEGHMALPPE